MRTRASRKALPTTETELRLIASAAIIGLSKTPDAGYRMPGTAWAAMVRALP